MTLPIRRVGKPGPFVWKPHQLYIQRQRHLARIDYWIPRHLRRHRRLSERQQRVGLLEPWRGKCGWQAELHSYVNMRGTRMRGRRTVHNRELLGFHLIPLPIWSLGNNAHAATQSGSSTYRRIASLLWDR